MVEKDLMRCLIPVLLPPLIGFIIIYLLTR
ncbi:hypothetical protein [Escherichia phage PH1062]|nr:hypothetical protein [Escherichia phage PH1062]